MGFSDSPGLLSEVVLGCPGKLLRCAEIFIWFTEMLLRFAGGLLPLAGGLEDQPPETSGRRERQMARTGPAGNLMTPDWRARVRTGWA